MQLTGTYIFTSDFGDNEYTNPTLEVTPKVYEVDPSSMTINVEIKLIGTDYKVSPNINPVSVNNLDYNAGELVDRIIERLEEFKI